MAFVLKETYNALFVVVVHGIARNAVIDFIRWRERECRDGRSEAFSLNDLSDDAEDPEQTI
jgi:hypothetical protein